MLFKLQLTSIHKTELLKVYEQTMSGYIFLIFLIFIFRAITTFCKISTPFLTANISIVLPMWYTIYLGTRLTI
jgi:hypothetical protein